MLNIPKFKPGETPGYSKQPFNNNFRVIECTRTTKTTKGTDLFIAGGFLAGLGVSAICGPAAPACAVAVVLIGSMAGGIAGSVVADTFDEELEELSHWEVF